jgi:hypothetical protein
MLQSSVNALCLGAFVASKNIKPLIHKGTKILCLFACIILPMGVTAQPSSDVFLFDLSKKDELYSISNPKSISTNPGYNNQPSFTKDGKSVLYSGIQTDEQTDIMRYDIKSGKTKRITQSPGSEYSPIQTPDGKFISTIILEKSGRQLLWKYPIKGGDSQIVIDEVVIGYHVWIDNSSLLAFVLGRPVTLQHINLKTGEMEIIAAMIGRSLHKIPGQENFSYISKADPANKWEIISLDIKTMKINFLAFTPEGSEDLAWTPDRKILMGKGTELFQCDPFGDKQWKKIADLKDFNLNNMTRLAVNAKGDKIAIVVSE